ncbi:MAG: primosomal replication protein N [Nitrosomonas sp.]|nr:primosomal replication protein N [Nitrosomonas sp.]MDP1950961.1 primosomal replication protein N [Nitrosomonas sp.]
MDCNQTIVCGKVVRLGELRYTPAGVAVIEFEISHNSHQIEAGLSRQIICDISAVALAQMAITVAKIEMDSMVRLTGFLAKKNRMSQQLVLHINNVVQL